MGVPSSGASPSYILSEDCEGAGAPSGWTDATFDETSGSIDWDYATSPSPLVGSQSVYMTSNEMRYCYKVFGATNPCYIYFICNLEDINTAGHSIIHIDDASLNGLLIFRVDTATGYARVTDYGDESNHESTTTLTEGTTYHNWLEITASGTVNWFISANATKPGSPAITFTQSNAASAGMIALSVEYSGDNHFDKIRVDDSVIGSNPE
jgi:hypothetical protein